MLANLNDVLIPARQGNYAVGLFNTINLEFARGVIAAAEELRSPVIIGTAEVLLPYGGLEDLAHLLIPMAKKASVPVVIHLDHGLNESTCKKALDLGFTSIMYDCSTDDFETNIQKVAKMAKMAHSYGASIEGELGHVGDNEGSAEGNSHMTDPKEFYTEPSQAKLYVDKTSVDALAIAVGTAHGAYKLPPNLDFERIADIEKESSASLVLHGGSGVSDEAFKKAIDLGISKVNVFTDLNVAAAKAAYDNYTAGSGMTDLIEPTIEAIKIATMEKMKLFNSINKA